VYIFDFTPPRPKRHLGKKYEKVKRKEEEEERKKKEEKKENWRKLE
jgi:hypothetical protein